MASDCAESALALWLAGGVSSLTHPVLGHAWRAYFRPLGIRADWLEAEPFSGLEAECGGWWLRGAFWDPREFKAGPPVSDDFSFLLGHPGKFDVHVDRRGRLGVALSAGAGEKSPAREWFEGSGAAWTAIRHSVSAAEAAEVFIYAAAGALLSNAPAAKLYAEGQTDEFCAAIRCLLDQTE